MTPQRTRNILNVFFFLYYLLPLEGPDPDITEYTLLFINGTEINNVAADNVKNIVHVSVKSYYGSLTPDFWRS